LIAISRTFCFSAAPAYNSGRVDVCSAGLRRIGLVSVTSAFQGLYMQNKLIIGKLAAVALLATLSAGCATKGYVNEQVAQAKSAADSAQATASAASSKADAASAKASEALAAAQAAQQCCVDTNEKIDRMFKKSMLK
jgi:hypothetical protein